MGETEAVEFIEWMVRQPSVSRQERAFALAFRDRLDCYGWDAHLDEVGNVVARLGHGPCKIGFLGHIDTVPGEVPVRREEGRLFGRGSVDAKGPLAAFVAAATGLRPDQRAGKTLLLFGCVEEETSTSKGAEWVAQQTPPDLLINGEPSGWDGVTVGYKGLLRFELQAAACRVHSAARGYRAPAEVLVDAWNRLQGYCAQWNRDRGVFESCLPSLRRFETPSQSDQEVAKAIFNVRVGPECDFDELHRVLLSSGASVLPSKRLAAALTDRRNPLVRALARAIREEGGRPTLKTKTGTSDWNTVASRWRVPTVAYGPGDSALDHTPHEHLVLGEYLKSIRILRRVLSEVA